MKTFLDLVKARQSDRKYDPERDVEPEKLERIIEAARLAPSACNAQPWHFVVVDDRSLVKEVGRASSSLGMNRFAKDAAAIILIVQEAANLTSKIGGVVKEKTFPLMDVGIAAAHIALAAEDEGLGSCIMGWFDEPKIKSLTAIPDNKRLMLAITIGYAVKPKRQKIRKSKEKVVSFNKY